METFRIRGVSFISAFICLQRAYCPIIYNIINSSPISFYYHCINAIWSFLAYHYIHQLSTMQSQSRALAVIPDHTLQDLRQDTQNFYKFHGVQMVGSQFPSKLVQTLHLKLLDGSYDGGDYFQVLDNEDQERFDVRATQDISAFSNVFIIDHTLTFRYPQLRKILKENPQLQERLENMLKYYQEEKKLLEETAKDSSPDELELDDMDLLDVTSVQFSKDLVTLSLMNNRLENAQELIAKLQYLNLKVLWLNGNPLAKNQQLNLWIQNKTKIQLFNSKFTTHCTEWGLKYAHSRSITYARDTPSAEVNTLNLDDRNIFKIDASLFNSFKQLRSISIKGHTPQSHQDDQQLLQILNIPYLKFLYVDEQAEKRIRQYAQDGLIPAQTQRRLLINKHSFLFPLEQNDIRVDSIFNSVFRLAGCYRLASSEQLDESSCWYVNDELGSYLNHSDQPNIRLMPFLYAPNNKLDENVVAFSLMWPIKDIKMGDLISRDFLNGYPEARQRSSRLSAWYKVPEAYYSKLIEDHDKQMLQLKTSSINLLASFYKNNSQRQKQQAIKVNLNDEKRLKVISDYEYINKYLKHPGFQIVSELQGADIVWLVTAAEEQEWKRYQGKFYLNQFPFESCIVLKNNLARTVQTVFGDSSFLQRTYDLETQLPLFVGDFKKREKQGRDNLWILKPPNMARSMDMIITDNLPLTIRAMQTGPKLAQKYISNPVLRRGRKVDLRYILLVKSVSPLTLHLYKNFWIRSANNQYTLDRRQLSTYETQFTVMNYGNVSNFQQIKYKDFIEQFQKDYKSSWSTVHERIKKMLRNVFIAVATKHPEMHHPMSRAYYGIDVMVDADNMEPQLLEITFSPDCKRACEYYPTFYDDVFQTLFKEEASENMERII